MSTYNKIWIIGGALLIACVSYLMSTADMMSPLVPMPIHMAMLFWTFPFWAIFVMPVIYVLDCLLVGNRKNFGEILFISSLFLCVLSVLYFCHAWKFGVQYQGVRYTIIVIIENLLGFLELVVLSYRGMKKKSAVLQYSANLLLFLLITWCAFPYLGELP